MKTAVSIPDDVFEGAELLAKRLRKSRSELYSHALREYISRHSAEDITEALDQVWSTAEPAETAFATAAGRLRVRRSEW
jgi:metal-responsive CopG/Arc/MetJ family transcriptional regulator